MGEVSAQSISTIERASGTLATQSVARMDATLAWFRELPANQRSWVTLVAQAAVTSFVAWLREPVDTMQLASTVFGAAPPELTRTVSLRQTVELVRVMVDLVEERGPALAAPGEETAVRESVLRFSREIAFAAARVYAGAAESRGAWDARLEALVIDGLVRASDSAESAPSTQAAALGWRHTGPVTAVVGMVPADRGEDPIATTDAVHRLARRLSLDCMAGVHGQRLVVVLGGVHDAIAEAGPFLPEFAPDHPVVVGPLLDDITGAGPSTRAALSALDVAAAWPGAPRPVGADELLAERALAGDRQARSRLVDTVYLPLHQAEPLLATVDAYFACGNSVEATARSLFVHPNTVRYRLGRIAGVCGLAPSDARESFTLRVAVALGRLTRR